MTGKCSLCNYVFQALKILEKLPEETQKKLAGKGYFLQKGFIMEQLPVPPNCLCVPEISDGKCVMSSVSILMMNTYLSDNCTLNESACRTAINISFPSDLQDISKSLLKKILGKIELIKRSRSGSPSFESYEIETNDLQSSIALYMNLRGTTKVHLHNRSRTALLFKVCIVVSSGYIELMNFVLF